MVNREIVDSSNHPVILPQYPSAINTNKTPYPEGIINPIQKKTITKNGLKSLKFGKTNIL